jgi:predicted ATPase
VIPDQVKMFKRLSETYESRPGAQVLVCTHSLKFFEQVESQPNVIRLVKRGSDGRSSVEVPTASQRPSVSGWAGLS